MWQFFWRFICQIISKMQQLVQYFFYWSGLENKLTLVFEHIFCFAFTNSWIALHLLPVLLFPTVTTRRQKFNTVEPGLSAAWEGQQPAGFPSSSSTTGDNKQVPFYLYFYWFQFFYVFGSHDEGPLQQRIWILHTSLTWSIKGTTFLSVSQFIHMYTSTVFTCCNHSPCSNWQLNSLLYALLT